MSKKPNFEIKEVSKNLYHVEFAKTKDLARFEEKNDKKRGIIKWGSKNDYPDCLLEMFEGSSYHGSIVSGKAFYIGGGGFVKSEGDTADENAELNAFLMNAKDDDDLDEILEKISLDLELYGGFSLEVWWSQDGKKIARIGYLPIENVRFQVEDEDEEERWEYSENWKSTQQSKEKTNHQILIPFDRDNPEGKQAIIYIEPSKGSKHYPKPGYQHGLKSIKTDFEITNFHQSLAESDFTAGTLINFPNGEPETNEERQDIERRFVIKHHGSEEAGKSIISFSDGPELKPQIETINGSNLDQRYIQLNKATEQKIFTAHKVTNPMLFGIKTEGQLGGRTELLEAYEMFKATYCQVKQKRILKVFNGLARINGIAEPLEIKEVPPIMIEMPISEATISQLMPREVLTDFIAKRFNIEMPEESEGFTFSKEREELQVFSMFGKPRKGLKIVSRMACRDDFDSRRALLTEAQLVRSNFAEIDDLKNKILSFIEKNPRNDAASIAEAIGEPLVDVVSTLDLMAEEGLISLNEDGDPIGITEEGENQLGDDVGEEPVELGVVYSYEVRPDLGPEVIEGTRDFCRSLIALDRVYTRDEINQISALVGRDVWRTRGGFYHNPTSDVTTPHCRHIWFQNVVQVG